MDPNRTDCKPIPEQEAFEQETARRPTPAARLSYDERE